MSSSKDTIWLLLGVLLIFGTMAAFSPGSRLGKSFLSVRRNMENIFGGGVSYCPFINPYAMSIYSSGGLEIVGDHPLCGPIKYAMSGLPDDTGEEDRESFDEVTEEEVLDEENPMTCDSDGESFLYSVILSDEGDTITVQKKRLNTVISEASLPADTLFAKLSVIQQADVKNSNKIAIQLLPIEKVLPDR